MAKAKPWLIATGVLAALLLVWAALNWRNLVLTWAIVTAPNLPPPRTELFAGLPREYAVGREVLTARLEKRLPPGTREEDLQTYLLAQGLRAPRNIRAGERGLMAQWGPAYCGSLLSVSWTVGDTARLKALQVVYGDSGCL
jgi:hypothetical protein